MLVKPNMQTIERRSGMHAVFVGMRVPNADDQTEHRNQCRGIVERAHHGIASRPLYWGSDTVLDGCTTAHTVRRGDAQPGILKSATTGQVFTQMPVCLKVDKKLAYVALLFYAPSRAAATLCILPPPPSAPRHRHLLHRAIPPCMVHLDLRCCSLPLMGLVISHCLSILHHQCVLTFSCLVTLRFSRLIGCSCL